MITQATMWFSRRLAPVLHSAIRFVKQKKHAILLIIISLVLAVATTRALISTGKTEIESYEVPTQFTISNETKDFPPIQIHTTGPSYFTSVGRVYVYFSSPYATMFKTFEVNMSLDNVSWKEVPLLDSQSNDRTKFADLGLVDLSRLVVVIYGRYYVPPQKVQLPPNVTKEDLLKSLKGNIMIQREPAPRDTIIELLVDVTLFGVFLRVADLLFLKERQVDHNAPLNPTETHRYVDQPFGL